jgi:hypothetical protein
MHQKHRRLGWRHVHGCSRWSPRSGYLEALLGYLCYFYERTQPLAQLQRTLNTVGRPVVKGRKASQPPNPLGHNRNVSPVFYLCVEREGGADGNNRSRDPVGR